MRGIKKEEAEFKQAPLTTIRAAALARNQYWTAAAWLLERKYPDEYGKADRQRNGAGDEAAPKIVLGVVAQPVQTQMDFGGGAEGTGAGAASDGPIYSVLKTLVRTEGLARELPYARALGSGDDQRGGLGGSEVP